MKKELNNLKKELNEVAKTLGVDVYMLHMEEDTKAYHDFGKKFALTALMLFMEQYHSGTDLRLSFISTVGRSRECDFAFQEVGFWEDLGIILCLCESLEYQENYVE